MVVDLTHKLIGRHCDNGEGSLPLSWQDKRTRYLHFKDLKKMGIVSDPGPHTNGQPTGNYIGKLLESLISNVCGTTA
jgi:hypothetical protein